MDLYDKERNKKQYHILLIEDNIDNIELANEILCEEGYRVGIAKNGVQALEYLEKNDLPDLFLLDIAMPEMDGFQTCIHLKEDERTADIPIIFLTALNDTANIVKGFELGAVDYVLKPFNFYELLIRVKTHIELKESREKLLSINTYLEKEVEQRTQELRKAYERLEHLDKAKTEFLSLISHELRTPLNAITGYFSLLNEMGDENAVIDDNFKNSIEDIIKKLLRFSDLSILFTELRSSYYASKTQEIDLKGIVKSILEPYKNNINNKNLVIKISVDDDKTLIADNYLLTNCLDIVIDNAIKFSPENGEINVMIDEDDEFTSIIITDDGPGFTDKARNYLFELFETDNFSNTYSGFGLGMATVKLILDTVGGQIQIDNKAKKGAIIKLSFKRVK